MIRKWFLLALLVPSLVIGPPPSPVAAQIRVDNLDKLDIVTAVYALFESRVVDGGRVMTLGYYALGDDGGNSYVYDADSTATIDGGFVLPGRDGVMSFNSSGTFNGTAGNGRYIAVDQSVANMRQFGGGTGLSDDEAVLTNAMNSGAKKVHFPEGTYNFDNFVNLRSGIKYYGDGMGRTIVRRSGTQRPIFAISTYDFESFNSETFVEHKEDIEICDMTLDWAFSSGWVDNAGLIQFKGSDTGNDDRIQDIAIRRVAFIDSASAAHGTNDAWAINVSAAATIQRRLIIEGCKQLAEHHQFISGGGLGWEDVTYRNNYVYHPQANGITATTVTASASFKRLTIVGNTIVGPHGLGIWAGPDQVSEGGTNDYEQVVIRNNTILLDDYSVGGTTSGVRINCSEGNSDEFLVEDNIISKTSDFGGSVAHAVIVENEPGQTLSTDSDYTQPAVGAQVTVELEDIGDDTPTGVKVVITGGGVYSLDEINGNDIDGHEVVLTLLANHPAVPESTVVPMNATVETFGTLRNVVVKGNTAPDCRISIDGATRCSVVDNSAKSIELLGISVDNTIKANRIERLSVSGYQSGIVEENTFFEFDDSSSIGNIQINVNDYRGMAGRDSQLYIRNTHSPSGGTVIQNRFVLEVAGVGDYAGKFYDNIIPATLLTSLSLQNPATRRTRGNIYQGADADGLPASMEDAKYWTESLDFDLTSANKQTLVVSATGVNAGDLVFLSVPASAQPDGGLVQYTVLSKNNLILVTATRTDSAVAANPGSGTFQFVTVSL